jgi:hypothetical protein
MIRRITLLIKNLLGSDYVIGTNLYCGHRPLDAPNKCLVVLETAGGALVEEWGMEDRVDKDIQVISRGESYFEARDEAVRVFEALHDTQGWNLPHIETGEPDLLAMSVGALTDPQYIGQDDKGLYEFSVNFIFRIEEASCSE